MHHVYKLPPKSLRDSNYKTHKHMKMRVEWGDYMFVFRALSQIENKLVNASNRLQRRNSGNSFWENIPKNELSFSQQTVALSHSWPPTFSWKLDWLCISQKVFWYAEHYSEVEEIEGNLEDFTYLNIPFHSIAPVVCSCEMKRCSLPIKGGIYQTMASINVDSTGSIICGPIFKENF